jgi:hypothetical protein
MLISSMCELVEQGGFSQSWSLTSPLLKSEQHLSLSQDLEWEVLRLGSVTEALWLDGGDSLLEGHPQGQIPHLASPPRSGLMLHSWFLITNLYSTFPHHVRYFSISQRGN